MAIKINGVNVITDDRNINANNATGNWIATEAQVSAGVLNTKIVTPIRAKQAAEEFGGGTRKLATRTASSDTGLEFTEFDSSIYSSYLFVFGNVIPVQDNVSLWLRTSNDGGSTFDSGSTDYYSHLSGKNLGGATFSSLQNPGDNITMATSVGNDTGEDGISGNLWCYYPSASKRTMFTWDLAWHLWNDVLGSTDNGFGIRDAAEEVDGVRFNFSTGNILSGTITMYGFRA